MKRVIACILALLLAGCAPAGSVETPTPPDQEGSASVAQSQQETPPEPVVAHLLATGDIMSHMPITKDAYIQEEDRYDYSHMLQFAADQFAGADYVVGNLETVLAGGPNYSGFPTFNSPDALADGLAGAGMDLVTTANNHTMDQGLDGLRRTLDVLDQAGISHVGTYRTAEERAENGGIYVADVGGISVAFLAYTYGLNGFRLPSDAPYAVNRFNLDYYTTLSNPVWDTLKEDMSQERALGTDLIAVLVHWGTEYQDQPNQYQTNLAEFLVGEGADLVLGNHPHVLQPYTWLTATGEDGTEHTGFVCYSLGNFLSNQLELETKTTAILDLELTKDPRTGETTITEIGYVPYYMIHLDDHAQGERRYLLNLHDAIADYESGTSTMIESSQYEALKAALEHCHNVLGREDDIGGWQ